MLSNPERHTTSVLLIDESAIDRAHFVGQLKRCSPDFLIVEAANGQSGLALYRSQQIDCVVTDLVLSDRSGFEILADLVPVSNKPQVGVIVLTRIEHPAMKELAKQYGAYAYLVKQHTSGEELDHAIQQAIKFVELIPKDDRYRPI
jgi:DNA-binding NarL/FixJ family response regulator